MVAVVKHPLLQQIADLQLSDLGMQAHAQEIIGT